MRALVTGSHGFAGTHLRRLLGARGWKVVGVAAGKHTPTPGEEFVQGDLASPQAASLAVAEANAEVVFHLAARAGRGGEGDVQRTLSSNVIGTHNLMAALLSAGRPVRVVNVGSSAQYGALPPKNDPVDESAPQNPLGLYGWSKTAGEAVAMAYHGRGGIEVIAARPFNHTGPGEPQYLVCSGFARQLVAIERGQDPVIHVGNLQTVRDFTDVRDLVRGYVELAERGTPGRVYNLCSGRGTSVRDVLRMLLDKSQVSAEVRADPARSRADELTRQVGSFERVQRETGWEPSLALEESLSDLLEDWRGRLKIEAKR